MRTRAHTCIHTHTQTDRHSRKCLTVALPPQPDPLSLCCCQIKAWRAGHKGECVMAAARADMRTAAKPTADQMRVLKILEQLAGAADWRGVAAQERAARAVAAAVRTSMPSKAAWVYCILGIAYQVAGELFQGHSTYHKRSTWRLQRRWASGRGRARRTGTSASRISRRGTSCEGLRPTTRRTWRLQRRWATGRGRAGRTRTYGMRESVAGGLQQGHHVPRAAPGDCKGGGRPGGGGRGVREPRVRV